MEEIADLFNVGSQEQETVDVSIESHDVVGLGFNIAGNMSDGIFVSEVLKRGPASESGSIGYGRSTFLKRDIRRWW